MKIKYKVLKTKAEIRVTKKMFRCQVTSFKREGLDEGAELSVISEKKLSISRMTGSVELGNSPEDYLKSLLYCG